MPRTKGRLGPRSACGLTRDNLLVFPSNVSSSVCCLVSYQDLPAVYTENLQFKKWDSSTDVHSPPLLLPKPVSIPPQYRSPLSTPHHAGNNLMPKYSICVATPRFTAQGADENRNRLRNAKINSFHCGLATT